MLGSSRFFPPLGQPLGSTNSLISPGANLGRSTSPADQGYEGEFQPHWAQWNFLNQQNIEMQGGADQFKEGSFLRAGAQQAVDTRFPPPIGWRPQLHDPGFATGVKPKTGT